MCGAWEDGRMWENKSVREHSGLTVMGSHCFSIQIKLEIKKIVFSFGLCNSVHHIVSEKYFRERLFKLIGRVKIQFGRLPSGN